MFAKVTRKSFLNCRMLSSDSVKWPSIVFLLGGPGSGKGTQAELLLNDAHSVNPNRLLPSHIYHVNVGGLLRDAQSEYRTKMDNKVDLAGTHLEKAGPVLEEMMSTGAILPSWVTITIMKQHLLRIKEEIDSGKYDIAGRPQPMVLIDGFPRSEENFEQFEQLIEPCKRLVVIRVGAEAMIERISKRSITSGRADDQSVDTIKRRINVFEQETGAVIRKFTAIEETNATNKPTRVVGNVDGAATQEEVYKVFVDTLIKVLDYKPEHI